MACKLTDDCDCHIHKLIEENDEGFPNVQNNNNNIALDKHVTIEDWECANNRGFWGNSNTGYVENKYVK